MVPREGWPGTREPPGGREGTRSKFYCSKVAPWEILAFSRQQLDILKTGAQRQISKYPWSERTRGTQGPVHSSTNPRQLGQNVGWFSNTPPYLKPPHNTCWLHHNSDQNFFTAKTSHTWRTSPTSLLFIQHIYKNSLSKSYISCLL